MGMTTSWGAKNESDPHGRKTVKKPVGVDVMKASITRVSHLDYFQRSKGEIATSKMSVRDHFLESTTGTEDLPELCAK